MRIGIGYDIHKLVKGRMLILGGEEIPFEKGLLGHSDADVLLHAVCDALLGACGESDIGSYFPDTDQLYKGISSLKLLEKVNLILERKGYRVNNIDVVVIAEKPRISAYVNAMKKNISGILKIPADKIGIKATTNEGIGAIGKGDGIASYAAVLIEEK